MRCQVVTVDPEKARAWLQKNAKNRKIRYWHVDRLAKVMLDGKWSLNGQTISFSSDGTLLDGQHRLLAVVQSGVTIQTVVSFGVDDPNAFKTYDATMLKRGVEQIAGMMGIENKNLATAISRRLLHWDKTENKKLFTLMNESYTRLEADEILDYIVINNNEIQSMIKDMSKSLPARRCKARSAFIAALIICNRKDEVASLVFNEGIITGANLPVNSPIHLLRDRLIDPPSKRGMGWENEVMALTIKAWNKHLIGKPLKHLRWIRGGDTPEYFPVPGDK